MIQSRAHILQPYASVTNQCGHFIVAELIKQNFMAQSRFMQWDALADTWLATLGGAADNWAGGGTTVTPV